MHWMKGTSGASFEVMEAEQIEEALTHYQHFAQAELRRCCVEGEFPGGWDWELAICAGRPVA